MASKAAAQHPWDKQMVFAQERKASLNNRSKSAAVSM